MEAEKHIQNGNISIRKKINYIKALVIASYLPLNGK